MKTQILKCAKKFFAVLLSVTMVLQTWGGLSFVSDAATSTTPEDGVIGEAFPTDYANYDFTQSDAYYISTAADLVNFADASKTNGFEDITIHLAANIACTSDSFAGIGSVDVPFCGTFDGHGYTISGLYSTTSGLFLAAGSTANPVTIKNFTVDNATISGTRGAVVVSTICGNPQCVDWGGSESNNPNQILNVNVVDSVANFSGNNCGIIIGGNFQENDAATVDGCTISGTTLNCVSESSTNAQNYGMIIGYDVSLGYSRFTNNTIKNSKITANGCTMTSVGMVAGKVTGRAHIEGATIEDCDIELTLTTTSTSQKSSDIGGIAGTLNSSASYLVDGTVTNTTITTNNYSRNMGLAVGCVNGGLVQGVDVIGGSITTTYNATADQAGRFGGVVGSFGNVAAELIDCTSTGVTVNCASRVNSIGGLIGSIESNAVNSVVENCTSTDFTINAQYASATAHCYQMGGALGRVRAKTDISNVDVSDATISLNSLVMCVGGFAGYMSGENASMISNCSVNTANIIQASSAATDSRKNFHMAGFTGCVDSGAEFTGCSVDTVRIQPQGRTMYYAGLIGSAESKELGTVKSAPITVKSCSVYSVNMDPKNNRNCNEFGGLVGRLTEGSTIEDCYVSTITASRNGNNEYIGGLVGWIVAGDGSATTIKNCYVEGCSFKARNTNYAGYMVGVNSATNGSFSSLYNYNVSFLGPTAYTSGVQGVTISDENKINGSIAWGLNTTNGTTTNSLIWTQGESSPELTSSTTKGTVKVTYKNPSGDVVCYTDSTGNVPVVPTPDEGYEWETTATAFSADSTVNVSYIGVDFPTDYENYDFTSNTAYQIKTVEQLVAFAAASKSYNFAGATVCLMADIDYAASTYATTSFAGIGSGSVPFCGTFDGHGYTISGLYSTEAGLFLAIGATDTPAIIQNFTIDKADISGAEGKAIVVSRFSGSPKDVTKNSQIIDVAVSNSTASFTGNNSGIIAGRGNDATASITISNCKVTNTDLICTANSATNAERYGIILGRDTSGGYSSVANCTVDGCDIISTTANIDTVGLVVGYVNGGTPIENCTVKDSTISLGLTSSTVTANVGALVGKLLASNANITGNTVSSVTITIEGLGKNIGGLVGCFMGGTLENNKISDSTINLNYTSTTEFATYIGGASGSVGLVDSTVEGSLTATNNVISNVDINVNSLVRGMGGFAGYVTGDAGSTFTGNKVTGSDVKTTALSDSANCLHVGGFVGCVDTDSNFSECSVLSTNIIMMGRTYYYAGIIGSTYSDTIASTATHGAVTVEKCFVETSKLVTTYNRNCNEHAGLIGYLSEGSSVSDCYVTGFTGVSNMNSMHVAGLIGYIPNVSGDATAVKNCLVKDVTLNGRNYLGEVIGRCEAANATFNCLRYFNCLLCRMEGGFTYTCPEAESELETVMTSGELAWKLNTTGGTTENSMIWTQGTNQPEFSTSNKLGIARVSYLNPSGIIYRYTDAKGNIASIPTPDFGYVWVDTSTSFTADTEIAVVESNSTLNGKTILFLGDSITAATRDDATEKGWAGRIGTDYGAITTNAGWSGASVSTNKPNRIITKMEENKNNIYDYVILHGGVNDAMAGASLGVVSDSKKVEDFDISTYAGALEELIYRANEYFPTAKIGFIVNYQTPNSTWGGYTKDMAAYFHTAKQVCEKWDVPYIDLFFGSVDVDGNMLSYSYDILDVDNSTHLYEQTSTEVHIGSSGYDVITPYIAAFIASIGVEDDGNLFDKDNAGNAKNTIKYNGTSKTDATACANLFTTHMIPVERGDVIYWGDSGSETYIMALYDKEGTFIHQVRVSDTDLESITTSGTTTGYNGGSRSLQRFAYEVKDSNACYATIVSNIDMMDTFAVYKNLEDTTGWPELKDKNLFDKDSKENRLATLECYTNTQTDYAKYSNLFTTHKMPVKDGDVVYWGGVGCEDFVLRICDADGNFIQQIRNNTDVEIGTAGLAYAKTGTTTTGYGYSTRDVVNFAYEITNSKAAYMTVTGNISELDNLQVFVNLSNTTGWPTIHSHVFGEWEVDYEPTCSKEGQKQKTCLTCGYVVCETMDKIAHSYELTVIPPTYLEHGYTLYTCSACGDTYQDIYVNPLERQDLSKATLKLEYKTAYYEGHAITPSVTLAYEGETLDASKEVKLSYRNNNQVGIATVIVEGINRFQGIVELQFEIIYEVVPEQIVNVIAISEIGKVSLSWGESSEVNTDSYNIYRKAEDETEYKLIKTISGRNVLSYEDKNVEKEKTYSYYVTGVGLYGAESNPSLAATATVLVDQIAPTVLKVSPTAASVISGETTLSATATDNIGVTKVAYFYTLDNGESWLAIGETTNNAFSIVFDTSDLGSESVKVKVIAYDAEKNESEPLVVAYSLDNVGPEKVSGLSAVTLSSKITLSWKDVTASDASHFILQNKVNGEWSTVAKKITTLGYTITGLQPDTEYIYRVACVDIRGNIGEYSDEFTVKTAADETAPVITSQSPSSARYNSTINFSATAKDDCDIKTIEIQVSRDLNTWTTISQKTYNSRNYKQTYSYAIDLSGYEEGSIYVRAIASDFSNNVSDTSTGAPYTEYIVDKTAPAAPKNVTANGSDGYITVSWSMGTEADLNKYFVYKSTSLDGNYQLIASNLSSLNYHDRDVQSGSEFYYKVKVSDTCGNVSEYSNAASATMSPDTQTPEITSISSTYQQKISNNTHTINVAATDNNKLSYIVVEYCTSNSSEYTQLVREGNIDSHYKSVSVKLPVDTLTDGDVLHLRAYAVDMAGLRSDYATAKYTMDTTPPVAENFMTQMEESTLYLQWTDGGEADLSGFKVYRSVDGETFTLLGSRGVSSTRAYSFADTITDKESKTYVYKLESIDRLGNTASWTRTVDYTYVYVNQNPIAQMNICDYMTVGVEEIFDASNSTDDIEITSYLWDFGDGTTSTEIQPVKRYDAIGTYIVKLSVTDNEGVTSTVTKEIEVKERDLLGTLNVKVVDDSGKSLSYVPVYFELGSDNQKIIYTNASGIATLQMTSGTHTIGMYASGYLPVKKDVIVLANATRTVTLTTVEEDIVTGNFEITRMTFDEIVAAGIDVYDPANQNVYSATVRVTYGSTPPLTINYVRNDDKVISYEVKDSNGNPVTHYTNSNGEKRKITGITYIPSSQGDSDVVAIIDIPAEASYLKEFFDVRLHIVNNASSEFVIEMNEVVLNVPEGMTLMTSVSEGYETSNAVKVDSIKGQETVTLAWVLRGDKAGEYDLFADFAGTLAEFNELVTAHFETEEPIKVYGLEGVKFRILAADEIHNDTLYFNVELENERDIDIYMPSIGLTDKIENITKSVLYNDAEGDFGAEAYILNAYIQTENGKKQYIPVTYDANGKAVTEVKTLAPGQKLVYEYVAYNAINYDGIAYFKEAAITEFEGMIENIEVGSFHKQLYSFQNYTGKLDEILSGTSNDETTAFNYIITEENYYYVEESENVTKTVLSELYEMTDLVLNGDVSALTKDEERALIQQIIVSVLADSGVAEQVDDLVMTKYDEAVKEMIETVKVDTLNKYADLNLEEEEIVDIFENVAKQSKKLAVVYYEKGSDEFKKELKQMIATDAMGGAVNVAAILTWQSEAEIFSKVWKGGQEICKGLLNAAEESEREAYYYAILKYQCNKEVTEKVLDAIIQNTETSLEKKLQEAIIKGTLGPTATIFDLPAGVGMDEEKLIHIVASEMRQQLDKGDDEFYQFINMATTLLDEEAEIAGKALIKVAMKKAIGSTPLALVSSGFNIADAVFGWGDYVKQQNTMRVYHAMASVFKENWDESILTRNDDSDLCSMLYLRAICGIRLNGEKQYKSFLNDYIYGKYTYPLSEEKVIEKINKVKNTSYKSIDEWYDVVQYNIVRSRDILFNVEGLLDIETPRAPVVSLDYDKLQTVQSFTSEYEYCFADGVWKACNNEPISFEVGATPSVIRVRKAASDTNFAGEITTVKIFARKDLSKLITVKFDGVNYLLDNLSSSYNYQVAFVNSLEDSVDWTSARTVLGSQATVTISGVKSYSYAIIRSCQNSELYETTSNPLAVEVGKKQPLNLNIIGSGKVSQTDSRGCYYEGDSVDLIATANTGYEFKGWYINGTCVSPDSHYIVEMADDLEVTAKFTGPEIEKIAITKSPVKTTYLVGEQLDLGGLEVTITYSDGSTDVAEQYTAYMSSNVVGTSNVVLAYGGKTIDYDISITDGIAESTPPSKLKFSGASIVPSYNISVSYKANETLFADGGYTEPYVKFVLDGKETIVTEYSIVNGKYVFDFTNITPKQMNDTIYATLYAKYNGIEYTSDVLEYSVATYCYNILNKYSGDEYAKLRTLIVDMLRYGAASQIYTGYKTESLVDAFLTEEQALWGTIENPMYNTMINKEYMVVDNPKVSWCAASLTLHDSVAMRFKIATDSIENLIVKVTNDKGQEWQILNDTFVATEGGYYIYFSGLDVKQMREVVYLTVYDGEQAVSNTLRYSIESYAYKKQNSQDENLVSLLNAMMKYGDSAVRFGQ